MPVTKDKPAPYATPAAIIDIIDRYRHRGLPSPVNAEVLGRAGIADSLVPRTMQAMQTLDLIDETGKPTTTFEGIRLAPEAEYKSRLEDWLKGAYADVFSFVDPSKDDEIRIRDAFRSYQPVGQQSRMVTLFQGLCAAAGLAGEKTTQARSTARPRANSPQPVKRVTPKPASNSRSSHGNASTGLPAPLAGLLASLPLDGDGWTSEQRKRFLHTFGAVLDFCFPIVESDAASDEQEDAA